ncbi:MAG: glycosyltransferase N-terminal domain-containing protein [Bacteroidota bacterium]
MANNYYFSRIRTVYDILSRIAFANLQVAQGFSKKLSLFVQGRKQSFQKLSEGIRPGDKTIWMHCASLGEYEQGVPVLEALRKQYPDHKMVLTFFSPSGYEVKKESALADVVTYLPFDTKRNAKKFLEFVHPRMAIFVKYEIWPNYLFELQAASVPVLLISGLFRKKQIYFKSHGGFMRSALKTIDHFFVQNSSSATLLEGLGIDRVTVSGDTRFDRVSKQIEMDNTLDFMEDFVGSSLCVVCGSTWPEDESLLLDSINQASQTVKFVLAPHQMDRAKIDQFRGQLKVSSVLYSEIKQQNLNEVSVLIVDAIGFLTKIYSYAHIAYVGGAAGTTGLHNILEAATFGVPIIIGKHFQDFPEAVRLQQLAGLFSVATSEECGEIIEKLLQDKQLRTKTGMIAGHFVNRNTGATQQILEYVFTRLAR